MSSDLACTICGTVLTGGIDTFGPVGLESCASCWYEYGLSGKHDPWGQLNGYGDTRYLDAVVENGMTVRLPRSRALPISGERSL